METELHSPKRGVTKQAEMQALDDEQRDGAAAAGSAAARPLVVYTLGLAGYQAA